MNEMNKQYMGFSKNFFVANRPFLARKWWILIILDPHREFFKNSAQDLHENCINGFSKKFVQDK